MKQKLKRSLLQTGTALDAITKLADQLDPVPAGQVKHVARLRDAAGEAEASHALTKGLIEKLIAMGRIPDDSEVQSHFGGGEITERPDDSAPKSAQFPADAAAFTRLIKGGGRPISGPGGLYRDPNWDRRR